MRHHHCWSHTLQQRIIGIEREFIRCREARHDLAHEIAVTCFIGGELIAGQHFAAPIGTGAGADPKTLKGIVDWQGQRGAASDLRDQGPAGPPAFHRIAHINWPALAQEIMLPAFAAIGRGFPAHAGKPTAMPHQQRCAPARCGRDHVLRVKRTDQIGAVGVNLGRHAAGREKHFTRGLASDGDFPPADMKTAPVSERDGRGHGWPQRPVRMRSTNCLAPGMKPLE